MPFSEFGSNPFVSKRVSSSGNALSGVAKEVLGRPAEALMRQLSSTNRKRDRQKKGAEFVVTEAEQKALAEHVELRPEEFYLESGAHFGCLPTRDELMDRNGPYHFYKIAGRESFFEGKSQSDLRLSAKMLRDMNVTREVRDRVLDALEVADHDPEPVIARLLDLRELFDAAASGSSEMDASEIYAFIDAAGYRPATVGELLQFTKSRWHPEAMTLPCASEHIVALGSARDMSDGDIWCPAIVFHSGMEGEHVGRSLDAQFVTWIEEGDREYYFFSEDPSERRLFLVVRK